MDPEKKEISKTVSSHFTLESLFIGLAIILGLIVLINVITASSINKQIKESKLTADEKLKPAKIELTIIKNSGCADCFDISPVIVYVKNSNVNITRENSVEFDSKEGKGLISKYKIKKVPSLIITGEIGKVKIEGLEKSQDALIFTEIPPPFTNPETGRVEGLVALYHLKDSKCSDCSSMAFLINQIKAAGVKISEEKIIEAGSSEGKEIIVKYKIGFVPAVMLSKDASVYPLMQEAWPQIGSKEEDAYVLRLASPPYLNLTTGKLRGVVDIVYLADKGYANCYNVSLHREILASGQSFGMKLGKEEILDIIDAKGKELMAKYNITKVPTVILSDEARVYPSSESLKQFFSVEKDGSYIFRRTEAIGTYKDLQKNEVVEVQAQQ